MIPNPIDRNALAAVLARQKTGTGTEDLGEREDTNYSAVSWTVRCKSRERSIARPAAILTKNERFEQKWPVAGASQDYAWVHG